MRYPTELLKIKSTPDGDKNRLDTVRKNISETQVIAMETTHDKHDKQKEMNTKTNKQI